MIPKLIIIADDARQRHALSDVSQACGLETLHCLAARQFNDVIAQQQPDLWIIDVENEDDILDLIGFDQPILIGMPIAPAFTDQLMYKRWKQSISRKMLKLLGDRLPHLVSDEEGLRLVSTGDKAANKLLPEVWRVVMLAASMGGLEAVKAFLDQLPADLPIAFLLVQHIDPYMQSQLPRILSRHNQWGFEMLNRTGITLDMGKVYIVPATQQISFAKTGHIVLESQNWPGMYQPSITEVMRRASPIFRQQLLTIVFSGMGDDGSHSAAQQIACGGLIWAQLGESCTSASQPDQMRATGHVSFNATPEGLAQQLVAEYQHSKEYSKEKKDE